MTDAIRLPDDDLTERGFYRAELAGHTVVIAVSGHVGAAGVAALLSTVAELLAAGSRVVLVGAELPARLEAELGSDEASVVRCGRADVHSVAVLSAVWAAIRCEDIAVLRLDPVEDAPSSHDDQVATSEVAARLAARLGVRKLVLTHELDHPRLDTPGFVEVGELGRLAELDADRWAPLVEVVRSALASGVPSVNLCHLTDIEQELFTYEGSGILVTSTDYLAVGALTIDEFDAVERLLRQGQTEGYLRARSDEELDRFLFIGFGARIATSDHLAGVGGLEVERYLDDNTGEVVGLYTISRFTGEGVGRQIVAALLGRARALGLRGVFACTTAEPVVSFFERCGFAKVDRDRLPPAKWQGYDAERASSVQAMWHDLA